MTTKSETSALGLVPVADLLRLADKIENDHAGFDFCACCSTDAIYLRDLVARYTPQEAS